MARSCVFGVSAALFCLALCLNACVSLQRAPVPETDADYEAPPPESELVESGFVRPGGTFNDPLDFIVANAHCCHVLCRRVEKCISWSRDRETGACALKDRESPFFKDDRFDSGVIDGVEAAETARAAPCFMEDDVEYPNGDVLREIEAESAEECCEACREDLDCFSWYHRRRSGACVLNKNVPPQRSNRRSDGASLF